MRKNLWICAWVAAVGLSFSWTHECWSQEAAPDGQSEPEVKTPAESQTATDEYYELMRVFVDTFEQIDRNYVKDVDRRELIEAAVHGMLSKLDPYSDYYNPTELPHFQEEIHQESQLMWTLNRYGKLFLYFPNPVQLCQTIG